MWVLRGGERTRPARRRRISHSGRSGPDRYRAEGHRQARRGGPMQASNDLIADVVQLPVRPGAAMRLLWMLDDTQASAADLGRLIDSDPELSTQVVRLANAPFYGLSGRVTGAW